MHRGLVAITVHTVITTDALGYMFRFQTIRFILVIPIEPYIIQCGVSINNNETTKTSTSTHLVPVVKLNIITKATTYISLSMNLILKFINYRKLKAVRCHLYNVYRLPPKVVEMCHLNRLVPNHQISIMG